MKTNNIKICDFVNNKYQSFLKATICGYGYTFKQKLNLYKKKYLKSLRSCTKIAQIFYQLYPNSGKWLDDFLIDMKNHLYDAKTIFNEIIAIYDEIRKNRKTALDMLDALLKKYNSTKVETLPAQDARPLFRARKKTPCLTGDIKDFYHIPFNKSDLISEQRFNLKGVPMLYLGSSILDVRKEMDCDIANIEVAAFLPHFSVPKRIYDFSFELPDTIAVLLEIESVGGKNIDYKSGQYRPNPSTLLKTLFLHIFLNILTFPVENKKYKDEYEIPQLLSEYLIGKGYDGIRYPSTKDFSDLKNGGTYSHHNFNYVFFTKNTGGLYDMNLLNDFYTFTYTATNSTITNLENILATITTKAKNSAKQNINEFVIPAANIELNYSNFVSSELDNIPYFNTKEGQLEMDFYCAMASKIESLI